MSISLCIQLHFYIIHLSRLHSWFACIFSSFSAEISFGFCVQFLRDSQPRATLCAAFEKLLVLIVLPLVAQMLLVPFVCLFVCLCEEERVPSNKTKILQISSTHSLFSALCVFTFFLQFFLLPFIRFMFCYTFLCIFICNCLTVTQQQTRYYFVVPITSNSQP